MNSLLNFEQIPKAHARSWNLKRMRDLQRRFGHPERGVFTVVIGGTKGKGSTGFFLSEILRQSGLRVGFYSSPHLEEARERIWIQGRPVSRKDFSRGLLRIKKRLGPQAPNFTYFEILTLLASLLFKEKRLDVAVFEVGMGGRLDATHTLPAKLVILTPIHFDHEAFLGNTLAEIAGEKAALLVPGRDVVTAPQEKEVHQVIRRLARRRKCRIWHPLRLQGMKVGLLGDFQKLNAAMAVRAARILRDRYQFPVTEGAILKGVRFHNWPGRMELFKGRPSLLLDGAHNPQSLAALVRNLKKLFGGRRIIFVFGTSRDKRYDRMIPLLSKVSKICVLTQARTPRAREVSLLLSLARNHFKLSLPAPTSEEALSLARRLARPGDLIVVTGSFYLVGEVRSQCRR